MFNHGCRYYAAVVCCILALPLLFGCGGRGLTPLEPDMPPPPGQPPTPVASALVLYDSSGEYGYTGRLFALQLQNLLGHFRVGATLQPVEEYLSGSMEQHDYVFYFGITYDNALPETFLDDVVATNKPLCWMGYNLWRFTTAHATQFSTRFGMAYERLDFTPAQRIEVNYNGFVMTQNPLSPEITLVQVLDPTKSETIATYQKNGSINPYIVRSGNFWHVGSNPFLYVEYGDRYFIFADCLHDILGLPQAGAQKAFIRIEDVSPTAEPEKLRAIADLCEQYAVPFGISVIPLYRDPLNVYNFGETVTFSDRPDTADALRYMVSKGGQIIQHGYTHQYGTTPNPFNGVSGEDYEFVLVASSGSSHQYLGPVPEDSYAWARDRVLQGYRELVKYGLYPVAWNTPHYMASPVDYPAFASLYQIHTDLGVYYTEVQGAPPTAAMLQSRDGVRAGRTAQYYFIHQIAPYPLWDVYGCLRLPETLGYIDPLGYGDQPPVLPAELLRRADAMRVVRNGWASGFFHPFLDIAYLEELIIGLKALGFEFTALPQ